MRKLSQRDAQIIARQICASQNREARRHNAGVKEQQIYDAYSCPDWQTVLRALSLEGVGLEGLPRSAQQLFESHIVPRFNRPVVSFMMLEDALRLVEFCGLLGHNLPEIESKAYEMWLDEQR